MDDVYSALDLIEENQEALQKCIYHHSEKIVRRDLTVAYFGYTNYYEDGQGGHGREGKGVPSGTK